MSERPRFRVETFSREYDRAQFSCGIDELDRYLQAQAGQDQRRDVTRVYLLIDANEQRIAGYYTLSASSLLMPELPGDVARRLPSYPQCPAILIGRLAVDQSFQGHGAGAALLMDALQRCLLVGTELGAFAVIVDAINASAREFYRHHEFIELVDDPERLFLPLATIRKLFDTSDV